MGFKFKLAKLSRILKSARRPKVAGIDNCEAIKFMPPINMNKINNDRWIESNRLSKKFLPSVVRLGLDSVFLLPLGNKSLLYRALLSFYNRLIEPSQIPFDKKFPSIDYFENLAW
jgi:hypothetical protein